MADSTRFHFPDGQTRCSICAPVEDACRRAPDPVVASSLRATASLRRRGVLHLLGSAVFFSLSARIAPTHALPVVHDTGAGVPVGPLLAQATADASTGAAAEVAYPVRTPGLVPGRLVGQPRWPHAQWLTQPLFLVGADEASRRWLRRHRAALQMMDASGLLVQARSANDLAAVQREVPGVTIAAGASPWLAARLRELNAAVLPLLIQADGVLTQQPQA